MSENIVILCSPLFYFKNYFLILISEPKQISSLDYTTLHIIATAKSHNQQAFSSKRKLAETQTKVFRKDSQERRHLMNGSK